MLPESTLNLIAATPDPALQPDPKKSRAAIKRCCAAWQRAYNASLQGTQRTGIDEVFAAHAAGPAYCRAMPPLGGYENIRDFIACAAHGILIEAIPAKRANQLLSAAQVALAALHFEPKSPKIRLTPTPLPHNAPFSTPTVSVRCFVSAVCNSYILTSR